MMSVHRIYKKGEAKMPKNTNQKNSKGKKTVNASTIKKVETKKVQSKEKVDVKNTNIESIDKKENITKREEKKSDLMNSSRISMNTLFSITLCIAIILLAALIYTISIKRVPKTSNGDEIIATIKGKDITANDLYETLKEENGINGLINIIDSYIADKEVTITDDDKAYVQEVVDYYKDYAEYYQTDFATFLANYVGLSNIKTEDDFYDYVLEDYKKTLAVNKFISDEASEEDLKKYYEDNYSDTQTVKHILIEVDSNAEDKDKADKDAYNKAVKLIKELNETSAKKLDSKFEELAKNNSDDTGTYANGGLYENFNKKDTDEAFWDAASKLKDGEYTKEPVKSTYGYHIILKVSSTPVEKYEDIKDDVKKSYAENKLSNDSTLFTKKWDELRKQYKLSIKDDYIKNIYEKTIKDALEAQEEEK